MSDRRRTPDASTGNRAWGAFRRLRSTRHGALLLLIPASILLLPMLVFPLGSDGAMFFISAQKILAGGAHYRDIVDVKPPLICYIYAAAITLFGSAEWSIRLFDLLIQITTCWMIITICRHNSRGDGAPGYWFSITQVISPIYHSITRRFCLPSSTMEDSVSVSYP